ncbi:MAG TPA: PEGA domain-containing protein [Polyangiaceae bacterium]|nr:PEGA domain-containing protein [Polyangiaceae bacterium]
MALGSRALWANPTELQDPTAAPAASRDAAAKVFRRGVELQQSGALAEALEQFEHAYQLSPAYPVLYYIGAVSADLRRWARARQAFELYLELGGAELAPERIAEVHVHLEELSKHTATLTLTLNVPGAEVHVDGAKLEPTSISGLILETGEHVVRVSKPGFQPLEQTVEASTGENLHLVLPLAPLLADEAVAGGGPAAAGAGAAGSNAAMGAPASGASPELEPSGVPLWIPWTVTGALAVAWATTAALAVQARHDRDAIEKPGVPAERIDEARDLHRTLAVVSDVLLVSTLASTGVSAYLTWWSDPPPRGKAAAPAQRSSRGLSLSVSGQF